MSTRHFLEIDDVTPLELARILALSQSEVGRPLAGLGVAIVLALPSSRTRNSTEMATFDLGGHPITLSGSELGIDSRETAEDIARTLAQYHRILSARVPDHAVLERMASAIDRQGFDVPVVTCSPTPVTPFRHSRTCSRLRTASPLGTSPACAGAPSRGSETPTTSRGR